MNRFFEMEDKTRRMFWGMLFILPAVVYFICLNIWPMFYSFFLSFNDWNLLNPDKNFVFLNNYFALLHDTVFLRCLINNFCYTLVAVPVGLVLSLAIALLLNSGIRWLGLFRFMIFMPVITSGIAAGYIWMWLYEPTFGLINHLLSFVHLQCPFLLSPYTALASIALMTVWKSLGFQVVILLAGLTTIPDSIYQAAEMDGATGFRRFWHVTLPLLNPTMVFLSVMGVMNGLQLFGEIFVMAPNGGPLNSTRTVVFHIQQTAFRSYQMGYGSAMTFVLFAIILAVTVFQMKVLTKKFEY
ncbi:MAG: sugar ABC transporter permease [Candidatus Wallbacteria bacterium]|nr:sugar ABC transporter permease [Candidatus Wallbacteria bacterium]